MRIKIDQSINWFLFAVALTLIFLTIYTAVQQSLRQSANDPQIQMAEDAAAALNGGMQPMNVVGTGGVDMAQSLAPFMIVYDASGKVLAASGKLNGVPPVLPPGVYKHVQNHGEDRITWQPQNGVRIAAVIVPFSGRQSGYVLAGHSLREVEKRENNLFLQTALAWIVTLIITLFLPDLGIAKSGK